MLKRDGNKAGEGGATESRSRWRPPRRHVGDSEAPGAKNTPHSPLYGRGTGTTLLCLWRSALFSQRYRFR